MKENKMSGNLASFMKELAEQSKQSEIEALKEEQKKQKALKTSQKDAEEHKQVQESVKAIKEEISKQENEKKPKQVVENKNRIRIKIKQKPKEENKKEEVHQKVRQEVRQEVQKAEQKAEKNGTVKEQPVLNNAGRPVKVYRKNQSIEQNYPRFDPNKEKYSWDDLNNPNLTKSQKEFITNRIREQNIKDELNKVLLENKDKIPTKNFPKDEENKSKTLGSIIRSRNQDNKNDYELKEQGKLSGNDLDKLFLESESHITQKERWFELYDQAWNSKSKTISNKKFKKGKFRLDKNGSLEILPDQVTYNKSSKDLLNSKWGV